MTTALHKEELKKNQRRIKEESKNKQRRTKEKQQNRQSQFLSKKSQWGVSCEGVNFIDKILNEITRRKLTLHHLDRQEFIWRFYSMFWALISEILAFQKKHSYFVSSHLHTHSHPGKWGLESLCFAVGKHFCFPTYMFAAASYYAARLIGSSRALQIPKFTVEKYLFTPFTCIHLNQISNILYSHTCF